MAVAGDIIGAGLGGWMNDRFGRRPSILIADVLFFLGAMIMAAARILEIIIVGRVFMRFGMGMVSMTSLKLLLPGLEGPLLVRMTVKLWIKKVSRAKGYNEQFVQEANAKIFTFGSYRLEAPSVPEAL